MKKGHKGHRYDIVFAYLGRLLFQPRLFNGDSQALFLVLGLALLLLRVSRLPRRDHLALLHGDLLAADL